MLTLAHKRFLLAIARNLGENGVGEEELKRMSLLCSFLLLTPLSLLKYFTGFGTYLVHTTATPGPHIFHLDEPGVMNGEVPRAHQRRLLLSDAPE